MSPHRLLDYASSVFAVVSIAVFGYSVWMAIGIVGDDSWGERAVAALLFACIMYMFAGDGEGKS